MDIKVDTLITSLISIAINFLSFLIDLIQFIKSQKKPSFNEACNITVNKITNINGNFFLCYKAFNNEKIINIYAQRTPHENNVIFFITSVFLGISAFLLSIFAFQFTIIVQIVMLLTTISVSRLYIFKAIDFPDKTKYLYLLFVAPAIALLTFYFSFYINNVEAAAQSYIKYFEVNEINFQNIVSLFFSHKQLSVNVFLAFIANTFSHLFLCFNIIISQIALLLFQSNRFTFITRWCSKILQNFKWSFAIIVSYLIFLFLLPLAI